jgi:type III secretory pathway component EscU
MNLKQFKLLLRFSAITAFCYLILPLVAYIIAIIFWFLFYTDMVTLIDISHKFIYLLNPVNTLFMRLMLLVSIAISAIFSIKKV